MWKCKLCEINNDDIRNSCIICGTSAAESRKYWDIKAAENSRRKAPVNAPGRLPQGYPGRPPMPPPGYPRGGGYGPRPAAPFMPPPPVPRSTAMPAPIMRESSDTKPVSTPKKGRGVGIWIFVAVLCIFIAIVILQAVSSDNNSTTSTKAYDEQYSNLYSETVSRENEYFIDFSDNFAENRFLQPEDVKICFV